jgi:undecaprenyl pyrophosphate phosphatase UppP
VIAGATLLKTVRLARRGLPPRSALPIAVGAAASFASTLGSTWLIRQVERDRSLLPYAAYRIGLAAVILARLSARRRPPQRPTAPPAPIRAESDPYTTMAT